MWREGLEADQVELQSLTGSKFTKAAEAAPKLGEKDRDIVAFHGYWAPLWKQVLFYILTICTFGVSYLCVMWFPRIRIFLTLNPCSLPEAEIVVVTLADKRQEVVSVFRLPSFTSINIQAHSDSAELGSSGGNAPFPPPGPGIKGDGCDRMLEYRCGRYLYSHAVGTFLPVPAVPDGFMDELTTAANSRRIKGQLTDEWQRADRRVLYGPNELKIPVKSVPQLLGEEMVHPFYVFQYVSVLIWCLEAYYSYSAIIVVITMFSILTTVVQAYRYLQRLAALAHFTCEVQVQQTGGSLATLSSSDLVPGDVVVVHAGLLPCDLVLLRGEAIIDENMLTGEAVPVRKVAYSPGNDGPSFDPDIHKACTLYGGTTVAQVRPGGAERMALGVVVRTAFWTAKGQLLKSILYPRQHKQTFASDAMAFIAVMLSLGLVFYVWDIIALTSYGAPAGFIILRYLDLVTVAVPPALPACLTVATAIAVSRLAEHSIFVSNPTAVIAAGHLDIICFDKTGTLTEPGLDLLGVVPVLEDEHPPRCAALCTGSANEPLPPRFQELLATCHGLAQLDGELVGDPLDQRLFEATGWRMMDDGAGAPVEIITVAEEGYEDNGGDLMLVSPHAAGTPRHRVPGSPGVLATAHVRTKVCPPIGTALSLGGACIIIRRFEFSSEKMRNVVVCCNPDGSMHVHVKGSPEMVRKLSDEPTCPSDFDAELGKHTREGLRVLGLATRQLEGVSEAEVETMTQEDLERGLRFIGFAVMVNPLRGDSAAVLEELQNAGIRTVMVTGDHARTAVSVAHQCGMIERRRRVIMVDTANSEGRVEETELAFSVAKTDGSVVPAETSGQKDVLLRSIAMGDVDAAVTGRGFERLGVEADAGGGGLETMLHGAGVFARMSPDDKRLLMELLGEGTVADDGEEAPGLGHHVGFCGDGANDVGALKAAHVGVSLCEAEASVAAPLTSKRQTIACMLAVVAEGRCSLDTSYLIFKFIIVYAFVQVFAVNLMYSFGGSVGNFQYLIQDLLYTTVLAGTMGFTRPATKLTSQRPPDRLMSAGIWFPVIAQFFTCAVFQLAALGMLAREPWYVRFNPEPVATGTNCFARATANSPECSQSWENSAVFIMSLGQFLITALVFNKGPPHRRPLYTNTWLLLAFLTQTLFLIFLVFAPGGAVLETFAGMVPFPEVAFRWKMVGLLCLNLAFSWLGDQLSVWAWQALRGRNLSGRVAMGWLHHDWLLQHVGSKIQREWLAPVSERAALCRHLFGADGPINVNSAIPDDMSYILLALRHTEPSNSGLDGLVVCSGLLRNNSERAPPSLALLPGGSVWAKVDLKCTFKVLDNTEGTIKPSTRYLDLDPAVKKGCTHFVTMGLALEDQAATIAAVVGFASDAAAQRAILFAKEILAAAKTECGESMQSVLKIAALLLSPQSIFPTDGYRSDAESDGWDEEEWTQNGGGGAAPLAQPVQQHQEQEPSSTRWTLAFKEPHLEERFRTRHAMIMFKFDVLGYIFIIFCTIFIIFLPGTAFQIINKDADIRVARSAIAALPALLFLTPRTRATYRRHRELFLTMTFLAATYWELHAQHYMTVVDAAVFTRPLYALGYTWLPTLVLLFQLRFRYAVPLTVLCLSLDATLLPVICKNFYPTQAVNTCVATYAAIMFCIGCLFPLAVLWCIECLARRVYATRQSELERLGAGDDAAL